MADATVSRLGQPEGGGAGTEKDLFLKVFSGEVLTAFHAATVLADSVRYREIRSGK